MVEGGVERRGRVYYMRLRVPTRYQSVEPRTEVNRSLRTRCHVEAQARFAVAKHALHQDWNAALAARERPGSREVYDASLALLQDLGLPWRRTDELVAGPISEIVERLERLAGASPSSAAVPAVLGTVELPRTLMSEMPEHYERIRADRVTAKNGRQLREWRNKYRRAATAFIDCAGDKPIAEITAQDARLLRRHWDAKRAADGVTTHHVNKQMRHLQQMVNAYHADLGLLKGDYVDHFERIALPSLGAELRAAPGRKLALPATWITDTLLDPERTEGLNAEARDITIVCAVCGTREAEITDLPPEDIVLDAEIPHLRLGMVEDGPYRRELKNTASRRLVPLLGPALEAMRRHPAGFPRYRGKAAYSVTVNKYFRERGLFPAPPEGETRQHTIGGLRHTFEDRMVWASIENEERALLMGHSLAALRGRPVYGAGVELRLRTLLAEKVAFATATWTPRPHVEIDAEIDRLLEGAGFRRR